MREHIYDSDNDFYRFYNNTIISNTTIIKKEYYDSMKDYYFKKYNKDIPLSYIEYYNFYIDNNTKTNYKVNKLANTTMRPRNVKYILTENVLTMIITHMSNSSVPSMGGYYYCVTVSSINIYTKETYIDEFTTGECTVEYASALIDYTVDGDELICFFRLYSPRSTYYSRNVVVVKYNFNNKLSYEKKITLTEFYYSNAAVSVDRNSKYIFVMTPHSSTTVAYVPRLMILDGSTLNVVSNLYFPTTSVASFGYNIGCNEQLLLISDVNNKIIYSYNIESLITNGITGSLDKTINNIYTNPLLTAVNNINSFYYCKINIDSNNNIYIGDYATEMYNYRYFYYILYVFPSKFNYDGVLQHQEVLPYNFIRDNITSGDVYVNLVEDTMNYTLIDPLLNGCIPNTSDANWDIISNKIYSDDILSTSVNNTHIYIKHTGKMPTNLEHYIEYYQNIKHLTSSEPLRTWIKIQNVNDKPILSPVPDQVTDEETPITITLDYSDEESTMAELLLEVTSIDYTMLTYSVSGDTLTLHPVKDKNGSTVVSVRVKDPQNGVSVTQSFTLTVRPINDKPITYDMTQITDEDTVVSFSLRSKVVDVDSNVFTYTITEDVTNGVINIDNNNGTVTYTPNPNFFGIDTFKFKVNDSLEDSNESTCSITVKSVNDAPVFTSNIPDIVLGQNESVDLTVLTSDIDDSVLHFRASGNGLSSYRDNGDGTITITANSSVGLWSLNIDVYDAAGLYDRKTINMKINRAWGEGNLVKDSTDIQKIKLTSSINYVMSAMDMTKKMLNTLYKEEYRISDYYNSLQKLFIITDFVDLDSTDTLNYNLINVENTIVIEDIMSDDFSMVIDKLPTTLNFKTDYYLSSDDNFAVGSYHTVNVTEVVFQDNIFYQINSIVYNINGDDVIFYNTDIEYTKTLNTFRKSNYALYTREDDNKFYLNRFF